MSLSLVSPPAVEPITLARAKARLRISDDSQDDRITHLIRVARCRVERETEHALLSQTWMERRDAWDGGGRLLAFATQFRILKPPLIGIEAITTYDADDAPSVWDPAAFFVDSMAEPGRIALKPDSLFPVPGRKIAGIEIRFVCGYGDSAEDVPAPLIEAVAQLVEAMAEGGPDVGLPLSVQSLIAPWRRRSL
jgi:uncharacterized phiE125 gp8 family phage protein